MTIIPAHTLLRGAGGARTTVRGLVSEWASVFAALLIAVVSSLAAAAPTVQVLAENASNYVSSYQNEITVESAIMAVLFIISGILFTFVGRRLVRAIIFLAGFWLGALIGYLVMALFDDPARWVVVVVCLVAGVIVGSLLIFFYRVGLAVLGGLFGLNVAMFLLYLRDGTLIESETGRIIFLVVMAVLGMVLILIFEKLLIITATAFIGPYFLLLGIDFFAQTGFSSFIGLVFNGQGTYEVTDGVIGMIVGWAVLFVVGFIWQWRQSKKYEY